MSNASLAEHLSVTGIEGGEQVRLTYTPGDRAAYLHTPAGTTEVSVERSDVRVWQGTLSWGTHQIEVAPEHARDARRLAHAMFDARQARRRDRGRSMRAVGLTLLLLSLPLFLGACIAAAANSVGTDICRVTTSWQSERPVEGCESGLPVGAGIAFGVAVVMAIVGMVALTMHNDN